ncbi:hypothetical protein DRW41_05595 [Neobacillus piezotolerans]|uniref:DUF2802 domain-containing protein n=1 Tax=Neobacillus piezotolerans TaxID=2259171 RepID=A0A3D8GS72_9BACI|nr:hypothetical protein [Neobacillus piezotolerans]RDU37323.1 hypothetical protein DRW41_05595 [Neobacillus piezotolerans]
MEWTFTGLFIISALMLVVSILKSTRAAKAQHTQIDQIHISIMEEINTLQKSIRNIELDQEVLMKEAGLQLSLEEKLFMREVLDLYDRKYSIESIAEMKNVSSSTIQELLAPYQAMKDEGRKVANEN